MQIDIINGVTAFLHDDEQVILLQEILDVNNIICYNHNFQEKWRLKLEEISSLFLYGDQIIFTDSLKKNVTGVVDISNGNELKVIKDLALHLPVAYHSKSNVITFASYQGENLFVKLDRNMNVVERLNVKKKTITQIIQSDKFITFKKGVLYLSILKTSEEISRIDLNLLGEIDSNNEVPRLHYIDSHVFDTTIVISVLNLDDNSQYLIGLGLDELELIWVRKNQIHCTQKEEKLYSLNYLGELRIIDPLTGIDHELIDLQNKFQELNLHCDIGLDYQEIGLLFKDEARNVIGLIDRDFSEVKILCDLPNNFSLGRNNYPIVLGNNIFMFSEYEKALIVQSLVNE